MQADSSGSWTASAPVITLSSCCRCRGIKRADIHRVILDMIRKQDGISVSVGGLVPLNSPDASLVPASGRNRSSIGRSSHSNGSAPATPRLRAASAAATSAAVARMTRRLQDGMPSLSPAITLSSRAGTPSRSPSASPAVGFRRSASPHPMGTRTPVSAAPPRASSRPRSPTTPASDPPARSATAAAGGGAGGGGGGEGASLSAEQRAVLDLVLSGKSVFFTGSAGTGKSFLLRRIVEALREEYEGSPDAVHVTASTGIAACNIGGVTIHR